MLTKHHFGDHDRLCGILSQGKNASPSSTIMIMCHGKHSSKDSMTYVKMEKMCQDFRLDSFRFDFRGHGESLPPNVSSDFTVDQGTKDVQDAIIFLQSQGYQEFLFLGSSIGAPCVINTLPKVGTCVLCIFYSAGNKAANYKELMRIGKKSVIPTCRIFGTPDTFVSLPKGLELAKSFPDSEIHTIQGAGHTFKNHYSVREDITRKFLQKQKITHYLL